MLSKSLKLEILEKLLVQYGIYISLQEEIKSDRFKLLKMADLESASGLKGQIALKEEILARMSDEMSFPTPSVWMMYKYAAYKGTDKEIRTCQDFVDHCSPEGYICTERYKFLMEYLDVSKLVSPSDELLILYEIEELNKLESDPKFMEAWLSNEFKITNNKISNWK